MSEDIGYRLRRAREARGLTVDEVADRIRIKKAYVTAMEQDSSTPFSPFYARSYLRTYAHFLGLTHRPSCGNTGNRRRSRKRRSAPSPAVGIGSRGDLRWRRGDIANGPCRKGRNGIILTGQKGAAGMGEGVPSHEPKRPENISPPVLLFKRRDAGLGGRFPGKFSRRRIVSRQSSAQPSSHLTRTSRS